MRWEGEVVYDVEVFRGRVFSGTINHGKLTAVLNDRAAAGWKLARTLKDERRILLLFTAATHYLIFERATQ